MDASSKLTIAKCIQLMIQDEGFSSSSSSSTEDEFEVMNVLDNHSNTSGKRKVRRKRARRYMELITTTTDDDFIATFKIKRSLYYNICNKFRCSEEYLSMVGSSILSPEVHMAVFLWFAGHRNCSFRDIANRYCIGTATVNTILKRVSYFLSMLVSTEAIKWPDDSHKKATSLFFFSKFGFPNIVGCIDATRIIIDAPRDGKNSYKDKNGDISLGLQAVCNEQHKFIDVTVGLPGSFHDSQIFQASSIHPQLPTLCGDCYLVGDSAYPCKIYLMTPFEQLYTEEQVYYNSTLNQCRLYVEDSFTMLKQRFPQLYYCKLRHMELLVHFIKACCVLHNLADDEDLDIINKEGAQVESKKYPENEYGREEPDDDGGLALREVICKQVFNSKQTPVASCKSARRKK